MESSLCTQNQYTKSQETWHVDHVIPTSVSSISWVLFLSLIQEIYIHIWFCFISQNVLVNITANVSLFWKEKKVLMHVNCSFQQNLGANKSFPNSLYCDLYPLSDGHTYICHDIWHGLAVHNTCAANKAILLHNYYVTEKYGPVMIGLNVYTLKNAQSPSSKFPFPVITQLIISSQTDNISCIPLVKAEINCWIQVYQWCCIWNSLSKMLTDLNPYSSI